MLETVWNPREKACGSGVDFKRACLLLLSQERGKLPVVATTDEHTWEVAVRASGALSFGTVQDVRAVRIKNTLHVGTSCLTHPFWRRDYSLRDRGPSWRSWRRGCFIRKV